MSEREWQSMKSAPRDGSKFLYRGTDADEVCRWIDDEELGWNDFTDQYAFPIHWMPLPAPHPQNQDQSDGRS